MKKNWAKSFFMAKTRRRAIKVKSRVITITEQPIRASEDQTVHLRRRIMVSGRNAW